MGKGRMSKGITPVVSILVLLLIAVALAGSAWVYISAFTESQMSLVKPPPIGCDPDAVEVCNGFDDNCNGQTDEGGVCGGCVPYPEMCDGIDNNCNNETDEGYDDDDCEEKCGFVWTGNGGSLNCCGDDAGEASPYEAVEVTVDGNDNDCDGQTDETVIPAGDTSTLININTNGVSYGHELLFKVYSTGSFDEFGSVVVEDGVGYVCGKVYGVNPGIQNITAFDATTGEIIWTRFIGDCDGTPLIDNQNDDYIYINTYTTGIDGLYKFNKTDGSIICNQTAGFDGMIQSLAQSDDLVFGNSNQHDHLHAFYKSNCSIAWEYAVPNATTLSGTPFYWENKVVATRYQPGMILQVNAMTGNPIWSTDAPNDFWDVQPSIKDGILYVGNGRYSTGSVAAYNFTTGEIIWEELGLGPILTQTAIYDNRLWVGGKSNNVYSLNIGDGSINCSFATGHDVYQGPAIVETGVSEGLLFIGSRDGYFYMLNTTDCSEIWKYNVGEGIFSAPAVARGSVYIATDNWYTYAFDFGLGTGDWKYLGYDERAHAYCTDCLTTWENVKASCTESGNTTCTITNQYSHDVKNITLQNSGKVNWYDSYGTLLKSKSDYYTINTTLASLSSVGFILETPVAEDGYISWWKFDGDATDETGMNDGTLIEDATFVVDAERGQVLSLDGDGDYVDVGNDASLGFTNSTDFTISAWVYKLDGTEQMGIATKGDNTDRYMMAYTSSSWRFEIRDGLNYVYTSSSDPDPTDKWVHVAGVYDSSINNLSLYVDGELKDSETAGVLDDFTSALPLRIGHFRYSSPVWNGSIDDVMIYNKALNETEITEIYNEQSP